MCTCRTTALSVLPKRVAAFGTTSYTTGSIICARQPASSSGSNQSAGKVAQAIRHLSGEPPQFTRSNIYNEWLLTLTISWRRVPTYAQPGCGVYEYYSVQHNRDRSLDSNFYYGTGATPQEQVRNGTVFQGHYSPIGVSGRLTGTTLRHDLALRGTLNGDGKTSFRGGYGIALRTQLR